ncbi:FtsX-like permease family protein [Ruminococcus sp. OA3]|uniref:ABC transporter permease n=1 Tax=Ruminococcus sp. OA3 TaxID=2914164 RepID=UPI001F066A59|nr:ABC transporter permease [Ruminococcus sp. OA3]MCH1983377.1 FtsX-like permease family protein [Ruminococcus sp. OA3]
MIRRILKKDLRRRKSVNLILFLFITMATIFLASSMNNILVVMSSVDYYMSYANVPDLTLIVTGDSEKEQIDQWLETDEARVSAYSYYTMLGLTQKSVTIHKKAEQAQLDSGGASIYLGSTDTRYCRVFDLDGNELTLSGDEIGLSQSVMEKNKLKKGDSIVLGSGGVKKEYRIKTAVKDAAFGSEMVGMTRIVVNPSEYGSYTDADSSSIFSLYFVDTDNISEFNDALNNQGFTTLVNTITRDTYTLVYSFDMVMAALLILIGICLIMIALLVLRFTLVFTIEEDYREIGIMKAIGMKEFAVKKIYLVKYFALVSIGALIGFTLSIPISSVMVSGVSRNMIMEDSSANIGINILCTLFIVILVLAFCYICTRRLNKISVIDAIKGGHSGESYKHRVGMRLHRRSRMPVWMYLGFNDIRKHPRRYFVLMITFCISFILITIPLNTLNTMQSREMAGKFSMDPDSAVYLRDIELAGEGSYKTSRELRQGLKRVEKELQEQGYQAKLTGVPIYFFSYSAQGSDALSKLMTVQSLGDNDDYLLYEDGEAPVLSNEIAVSTLLMEEKNWKIGDFIETELGGQTRSFMITGTYSDYMQLGKSIRMNPEIDLDDEAMFDCWNIMVDMTTDKTQEEMAAKLGEKFPEYEWSSAQEVIDRNVGGIQQSLRDLLFPMTAMLCAVIMLITLLMERLFIAREKGEIAMMKSVGYRHRTIKLWQVSRMIWVALISMAAAVPLSLFSNHWILKPIFAIMGADVTIQVVPWQAYGIFPGILLVGIILATFTATGKIRKINIRELNNLE